MVIYRIKQIGNSILIIISYEYSSKQCEIIETYYVTKIDSFFVKRTQQKCKTELLRISNGSSCRNSAKIDNNTNVFDLDIETFAIVHKCVAFLFVV